MIPAITVPTRCVARERPPAAALGVDVVGVVRHHPCAGSRDAAGPDNYRYNNIFHSQSLQRPRTFVIYLRGVEGAEREDPLRKLGDGSGAPSSGDPHAPTSHISMIEDRLS